MSWSVQLVGTPKGVNKELDAIGEAMTDVTSKAEFLEAKPGLQTLISQVVNQNVKLVANAHATFTDGVKTYGHVSVSLECFYGKWCE